MPTTENLCRAVFGLLKDALPAGELEHVRVEETENNFFECTRNEWKLNGQPQVSTAQNATTLFASLRMTGENWKG